MTRGAESFRARYRIPPPVAPPQTILEGKYAVLAKLSEGGMGAVYKVRHLLLDEVRVVKVILPHLGPTPELSDRFLREARAAARSPPGAVPAGLLPPRAPLAATTPPGIATAPLRRPPLPFAESDPEGGVPAGLRELVLQLLAKKPSERPAGADEVAQRLIPFAAPPSADTAARLDAILGPRREPTGPTALRPPAAAGLPPAPRPPAQPPPAAPA